MVILLVQTVLEEMQRHSEGTAGVAVEEEERDGTVDEGNERNCGVEVKSDGSMKDVKINRTPQRLLVGDKEETVEQQEKVNVESVKQNEAVQDIKDQVLCCLHQSSDLPI